MLFTFLSSVCYCFRHSQANGYTENFAAPGFLVSVPMQEEWSSEEGIEVLDGWSFQVCSFPFIINAGEDWFKSPQFSSEYVVLIRYRRPRLMDNLARKYTLRVHRCTVHTFAPQIGHPFNRL